MPPTGTVLAVGPDPTVMLRSLGRTIGGAVIGCTWSRVVLAMVAGPRAVNNGLLLPKATCHSLSVALVRSNFQKVAQIVARIDDIGLAITIQVDQCGRCQAVVFAFPVPVASVVA